MYSFQNYNSFNVYCRELALGTVSLTGDRAQGDDSKYDSHYNQLFLIVLDEYLGDYGYQKKHHNYLYKDKVLTLWDIYIVYSLILAV